MAKILVVNSNPDNTQHLCNWLHQHNYEVLTTQSDDETLKVAAALHPDVILLGADLSDFTSIRTCERLKNSQLTRHIPIILSASRDSRVAHLDALMSNAAVYLPPPIQSETLLFWIEQLLEPDRGLTRHSERLLQETVQAALAIVPCRLAWLLTIDSEQVSLVSQAVETSYRQDTGDVFLRYPGIPLSDNHDNILIEVVTSGEPIYNLPLSKLRDQIDPPIYRAIDQLNLFFVSIVPLQVSDTPLGVMLLGTREPRDVESTRGKQIISAVASQAATTAHNVQLIRRMTSRETESKRERAFHQTLLNVMGDGLMVFDDRGSISYVNDRLSTLTEYTPEELLNKRVWELFNPVNQIQLQELVHTDDISTTKSFEMELLQKNGSTIPVLAIRANRTVEYQTARDRVMVIAVLSHQKQREQELTQQTHRLSSLAHATQAISSTLEMEDTIQTLLLEAYNLFPESTASVLLRTSGGENLVYRASVGPNAGQLQGQQIPADQGIVGHVIQTGQPVYQDDFITMLEMGGEDEPPAPTAATPIIVKDRVIGAVEITNTNRQFYNESDLDLLEALTVSAAIAIGNVRLYTDAQRHVRELTLLLKTSETASSTLSIEHILETVAQQLIDTLAVQWCSISSWERDNEQISYLAETADIVWTDETSTIITLEQAPIIAEVIRTSSPRLIYQDPDEEGGPEDLLLAGAVSSCLLPLMLRSNHTVGLIRLSLYSGTKNFSSDEIERAQTTLRAWSNTRKNNGAWLDETCLAQLRQQLLQATAAEQCTLFSYHPDQGYIKGLAQISKVIWPVENSPKQMLQPDNLRRLAIFERTPVTTVIDTPDMFTLTGRTIPYIDRGSLLITPLIARGEAIGLVELGDIDPHREFSDRDISLAQAIANVIGNALENSRLYATLLLRAAQLEAAYKDLQEADRLKVQWIQSVSHELRTPLTAIMGYCDLLLTEDLGSLTESQDEGLNVIHDKSRQLARLVEDILSVQHMEHEPLDRSLFDLGELAQISIASIRHEALSREIEITTDLSPQLPQILVDKQLIIQVFDNLLNNAIKFSPEGGQISISVEDIGPALKCSVQDEGIGIPPEEHDKIWRRFYQVDGSMTRRYGGTGLGLAIVKEVIEKHDGRVWVESTPGKGSTFSFILPKDAQDGQATGTNPYPRRG